MALSVNLYTFAKKVNSTRRPASASLSVDCILKEACSVIYPVIGLDKGAAWNPSAYNYAYISAFSRYYYVNDWSYSDGLWWASLAVDALATWRGNIYSASEYVIRASADYDGAIIDTMFPATVKYTVQRYGWNGAGLTGTPWAQTLSNGVYIVGIINNDSSAMGAVSYYAMTTAQFDNFKDYLLGNIDWTGILASNPDIGENLFKAIFNPFQYIVSIKWFPFPVTDIMGKTAHTSIKIGWWEIENIDCYTFNVPFCDKTALLKLYQHPQASTRGIYLNQSPYNIYKLFAPPFGEFDLPGDLIGNAVFSNGESNLSVNIRCDLISGKASLQVGVLPIQSTGNINVLLTETTLSIDIQLAQIYQNASADASYTMGGNVINVITSAIKNGGNTGARIAKDVGVIDAAEVGSINMSQIGNNGSLSQFYLGFYAETRSKEMTEDANTDKGRPLCKDVQLSTLAPGYVITAGSHIAIAGTETEISMVNDTLDGGVFLE